MTKLTRLNTKRWSYSRGRSSHSIYVGAGDHVIRLQAWYLGPDFIEGQIANPMIL